MASATDPAAVSVHKKSKVAVSKRKLAAVVVSLILFVAVVAVSGWFFYRSSTASTIDESRYQAVFFTSGQVYFGKLKPVNANYFRLTDVFYIQAQEAAATKDSENPQQTGTESTDIRLIKLGSEVHGPADEMIISKDQILFFENLKPEGKVADSIVKYNQQKR